MRGQRRSSSCDDLGHHIVPAPPRGDRSWASSARTPSTDNAGCRMTPTSRQPSPSLLLIDIHGSDITTITYQPTGSGSGVAYLGVTPRTYFEDPWASAPTDDAGQRRSCPNSRSRYAQNSAFARTNSWTLTCLPRSTASRSTGWTNSVNSAAPRTRSTTSPGCGQAAGPPPSCPAGPACSSWRTPPTVHAAAVPTWPTRWRTCCWSTSSSAFSSRRRVPDPRRDQQEDRTGRHGPGRRVAQPTQAARRAALARLTDEQVAPQHFDVSIEFARWRMNTSGARIIAKRAANKRARV
jgi:hypothetical protein